MQQRKVSNTYKFVAIAGFLALLTVWGCSPTRRLKPNQKLLNKVDIKVDDKNVSTGDMGDYIQQKPNRRLFGLTRFYLQVYNLVDSTKAANDRVKLVEKKRKRIEKRRLRRDARCNRRFARTGRECPVRNYDDEISATPFRQWVQNIGEPPALYDSSLTTKSTAQIKQYLFNIGYFFATVKDSTAIVDEQKVNVYFDVKAGPQYMVDTVRYVAADTNIQRILNRLATRGQLVATGKHFDTETIADEVDRLAERIKTRGYYFFTKEYIKVEADTAKKSKTATIIFTVKNPMVPTGLSGPDSLKEAKHIVYKLGKVSVNLGYDALQPDRSAYDTVTYNRVLFYYPPAKRPLFRPKTIDYHIFLRQDSIYSDRDLDVTLSRISDLRTFKFINIQFNPVDTVNGQGVLDCEILLTPSMRRGYAIETQGTNTGSALGVGANLSFTNKNLFRGEESIEFKVRGALEFQPLVNTTIDNTGQQNARSLFNTQEFGASITFNIPRGIFPITYLVREPEKNPRTAVIASFNYQARPQYDRSVYSLSFGWTWKQNRRMYITYNPVELSYLFAKVDSVYEAGLPFILKRSFDNQFVDAGRVQVVWSNQVVGKRTKYVFWRAGAEMAGLVVSPFEKKQDSTIFGVPNAKYFKLDFEIYPNFYFRERHAIATRAYIGVGSPYGNSSAIPFAKAFLAGGSNGMRAWIQRALGPGELDKSNGNNNFDQVGDIKLEFNFEYRVKLVSFLEPALFVDVGNVWMMKDNERPTAEFRFNTFYRQLAVGYGVGARLDLSFFLLRLDFAMPLRDPGRQYEKLWLEPHFSRMRFNLGIGYPF